MAYIKTAEQRTSNTVIDTLAVDVWANATAHQRCHENINAIYHDIFKRKYHDIYHRKYQLFKNYLLTLLIHVTLRMQSL